ncbi:glycosyltransferase [Algoriphagus formosus]|uniref:Glycosyltransferase n=2 Tax=Algoriphagus formosus TaxID=2007308 RepID=A0A4R5USI5_9BACT|nr:glycosyltransferase [Algoriphagus aquimaris]
MKFFDFKLTVKLPTVFPQKRLIANTINPHSYCVAMNDAQFQEALRSSDILVPDGVGVVWASSFLYKRRISKISGFDLHFHFLQLLQKKSGGKVFYLGSSETALSLIIDRVNKEFPSLNVKTYSPPFKSDFSKKENEAMIRAVNEFEPDLLFVGMTAPKQEKWVFQNKENLKVKVVCSIGAVFDFYAGTIKRPSQFWINLGLEWFPRFLKEPKRLWRRNLISTPKFIFEVIRHKLTL